MVKVFLLGRPGSGKTTAFHYIKTCAHVKGVRATRFREYTFLRDMFLAGRSEFRPAKHGGFDILDFSVLNESAKLLEEELQTYSRTDAQKDELLFIELVREDYSMAMRCFTPAFLQDAYVLYIEADLETCIQRILHRVANPAGTDGHFVSEHILRNHYASDNRHYMATYFKKDHHLQKEVRVIENMGPYEEFIEQLRPFADTLLEEEIVPVP